MQTLALRQFLAPIYLPVVDIRALETNVIRRGMILQSILFIPQQQKCRDVRDIYRDPVGVMQHKTAIIYKALLQVKPYERNTTRLLLKQFLDSL